LTTKTIDRAFAGALLLLGLYIIWNALEYGYIRGATPGPGFFPLWVGAGLAGLSVVNLVRSLAGAEPLDAIFDATGFLKTLGILAVAVVFVLVTPWIGMFAASGLLIPAVAFIIRPGWNRRFALIILVLSLAFPVLCHFLFAVYLRVPIERGVLGL
jgi:putative tricarboxylic transport membrane protein